MSEFQRLFFKHGLALDILLHDLKEIDADPVTVVVHKASQLPEGVLVEDTSLEIEGASVGIHVRWLLDHAATYIGHKAIWRTLLAYQKNSLVYVYEGKINGTIVAPRGEGGFGFDPFFLPDGAQYTLAEAKPDAVNARAKAVEALVHESPLITVAPMQIWSGPWQNQ